MKKDTTTKISRYTLNDGFFCDITETADMFEAWLGLEHYGVMDYMFGWPKEQFDGTYTRKDFLEMVEWNADEHIAIFLHEYRDDMECSHPDLLDMYEPMLNEIDERLAAHGIEL